MSPPCECRSCELLGLYGRVFKPGLITRAEGSERCWVCGVRPGPDPRHAWVDGPTAACSREHAELLVKRWRAGAALLASPSAPSASATPLQPTLPV